MLRRRRVVLIGSGLGLHLGAKALRDTWRSWQRQRRCASQNPSERNPPMQNRRPVPANNGGTSKCFGFGVTAQTRLLITEDLTGAGCWPAASPALSALRSGIFRESKGDRLLADRRLKLPL